MGLEVCFVGIGSIAKRHIRNLKKICRERDIELNIDAIRRNVSSGGESEELGIRNVYTDYYQLSRLYDVIFITNPTELHIDALKQVSVFGRHFFIEKPVSSISQIGQVRELKLKPEAVYYVACPLRYNAVIQYIKHTIPVNKVVSVRSISSSYLPEWRQGVDYRETYSAHKALGGGVSIDLIHEWDYLTFLFGNPDSIYFISGKKSELEIDSEDVAIYIAGYPDKVVELHLDYFGRKTLRQVMLLTNEETIIGDIANNRISYLKEERIIDFDEERDHYQVRELEHFLDMIEGRTENDSDIRHAVRILELTQGEI